MLIAVASKTGSEVDQHFGHAERFLIYDFAAGKARRVEEVAVEKYCSFDPENPMRHRQFDGIVEALNQVRSVGSGSEFLETAHYLGIYTGA